MTWNKSLSLSFHWIVLSDNNDWQVLETLEAAFDSNLNSMTILTCVTDVIGGC